MSSAGGDEVTSGQPDPDPDFVFTNNNGVSKTGFFSLPGLGRFDFDENEDSYFPFRNNRHEDARDPRQV